MKDGCLPDTLVEAPGALQLLVVYDRYNAPSLEIEEYVRQWAAELAAVHEWPEEYTIKLRLVHFFPSGHKEYTYEVYEGGV